MTEFTSLGTKRKRSGKLTLLINSVMVSPWKNDVFAPLTSSVVLPDTVALF